MLQNGLLPLIPLSIPLILAFTALLLPRDNTARPTAYTLTLIRLVSALCAFSSVAVLVWVVADLSGLAGQSSGQLITLTPLRGLVLSLVLALAAVLLQFSRQYLAGEACYVRYFRWLLLTLAAVSLTLIANHMMLFVFGWTAVSVCLHQLLTLYPERPRAVLAAHKKFILARVAESCVLAASLLLFVRHDSFYIDEVLLAVAAAPTLSLAEHLAAWLLGMAASIKCAQLPLHGWLIKVVEVPTPVSALLHAGVINLGGFMLLLFAPLFARSELAQWWVLLVAGASTVLAVLIMSTRISIKVRLAWSTSAQMGLMLMEIALGLYELALLHLLAHSLYKAHAFLNSGSAVNAHLARTLWQQSAVSGLPGRKLHHVCVVLAAVLMVGVAIWLAGAGDPLSVWLLLGIGLVSFASRPGVTVSYGAGLRSLVPVLMVMLLLTTSYVVLKQLFKQLPELALVADISRLHAPLSAADIVAMLMFATIASVAWLLRNKAGHPRVQRLSALLFAGLFLDEWFTRLTLKLWPASLPRTQSSWPLFQSSRSLTPKSAPSLLITQEP